MDWKETAKDLKFNKALSWTELDKEMMSFFPDLSVQQVHEKVRGFLRKTEEYNKDIINLKINDKKTFNYTFDNDFINLYGLGDLHCGASSFMEKELKQYIEKIRQDENGKIILLGDLIENATIGSKSCVYSQKIIPQKQKEKIIELLYPVRDKILSCNIGNHEQRTFKQTGNDIMYDICLGLGILDKYSPSHSYINIKLGKATYKNYSTHNLGKGEAALKKMAKSFSDIDILWGGHIHTPKHITATQKYNNGKQKDIEVIICNAWLYDEGYSISAAYEPVSNKPIKARIYKDNKQVEVIA